MSKTKDYRGLSAEDRSKELLALRKEQFNLRLQKSTGQLANTANLPKVRRNIARMKTVMNQKTG
jgi:large subunit ribosomal protein L29